MLAPASAQAAKCTFTRINLTFPLYDVASATPTTTSPVFQVTCAGNTTSEISIGASAVSGSVTNRQMKHATLNDRLNYNLYKDSGYSSVWGDTAVGAGYGAPRSNGTLPHTIYARIQPGQDVNIGNYSDTVTLTVTP
jgi:spore coat protein U-like protein